MTNYLNISKV